MKLFAVVFASIVAIIFLKWRTILDVLLTLASRALLAAIGFGDDDVE